MPKDNNGQADGNERSELAWIFVAVLVVVLLLAVPAGFVWHAIEVRRLRDEAALRLEAEEARAAERDARGQAEEERRARLAAEEKGRGPGPRPD
jgi:hypothetical protein